MRNGDYDKHSAEPEQQSASSSVELVSQMFRSTLSIPAKIKNVVTTGTLSGSPRKDSAPSRGGVFQSVWDRHRENWKLPEPSQNVLADAALAVERAGRQQKRKATKADQSSRGPEKRRRKS